MPDTIKRAVIKRDASKFVTSSSFRHGDALTFAVPLIPGEVTLPGRSSPSDYLSKLGITKMPRRVLVLGAGNGGLAVECVNRGATQVTIIETRATFAEALERVKELVVERWQSDNHTDGRKRTFDVFTKLPAFGKTRPVFDLILWPEALEECKEPPVSLGEVNTMLVPGGQLFLEVLHGAHAWVGKINSWKPTVAALREGLVVTFDHAWTSEFPGRAVNRKIYLIEKAAAPLSAEAAAAVEQGLAEAKAGEFVDAPIVDTPKVAAAKAKLAQLAAKSKKADAPPKRAEKGYKCGLCDEHGHNARTCPSKKSKKRRSTVVEEGEPQPVDADIPTVILDDEDFDAELDDE